MKKRRSWMSLLARNFNSMKDYSRLIEHAFPLRQASIDSVHEKNVRHGHISTLHIWPARRPLAASRAALLATLLADPGTPEGRKELCEKIGGTLKPGKPDKEGRIKDETDGGILRWKRETENKELLEWFRAEIRKANGGRAPKVLDPFSGGGAIPLEAMRLGCDVTAADLNPVAWFLLKCTLEYPQKLAGQKRPLPDFILRDREFMEEFLKEAKGLNGAKLRKTLDALGHRAREGEHQQDEWDFEQAAASAGVTLDADLAWHVRALGRKVLTEARKEFGNLYPTYAEWQPLMVGKPFEPQSMRLIEPDGNGVANAEKLNAELSDAYLQDKFNPRWVAKPAVAYLWARAVVCKNCRATIPLLKTRWLCKKENKRILLSMVAKPDKTGVSFAIEHNIPERGGNAAQKREHDKKVGGGTMSRAGAQCPCCPAIMKMEDIRYEGKNGRLAQMMTTVVVDGPHGKEYRLPTDHERRVAEVSEETVSNVFQKVPHGPLNEPTPKCGPGASRAFSVDQYGFDQWRTLFTNRQLVTLGRICTEISRGCGSATGTLFDEAKRGYLALALDRMANRGSTLCIWNMPAEKIEQTFARFALPVLWDFAESNPFGDASGNFKGETEWVALVFQHVAATAAGQPSLVRGSAIATKHEGVDVIVTDPPYYDAIPYSDLMDFFYVWLRRSLHGASEEIDAAFADPLAPKWNHETKDGELIDDAARHDGNAETSKNTYEDGMSRAFQACNLALAPHGRLVIVFAHKHPDAWETLVTAIIRAGFVVDGSWPIATERSGRMRANASAALASSVWLVCRKRDPLVKVGWDNRVMAEMRDNIAAQLREFWDAGIRGPDFVWAATGPAMEAYSKYPAVIKANSPTKELLSVKEFLDAVRRIVIEFVVGRVLHIESGIDRLDPVTSYYLLHRNDFAFGKAPAGACILYAVSCGLSDAELERTWNLVKVKGSAIPDPEEAAEESGDESEEPSDEMSGGEFVLRTWKERKEKRMGYESVGGREIPLIDRVHRLMHLWRDGDVRKVDDYLDEYALRQNELFGRLIQSLIELSEPASEERSLLESLSNHLGGKAAKADTTRSLGLDVEI
jgi:putative DNA methylase